MKKLILILFFLAVIFSACDDNGLLSPEKRISKIQLDIQGLSALPDTLWYEAWISWLEKTSTGEKTLNQSLGVFSVNSAGAMLTNEFEVNIGYLQGAQTIYITIEEDDVPGYRVTEKEVGGVTVLDSAKGPSRYKILAAKVIANSGYFSIGDPYLLDYDFSTASGFLMNTTPTDTGSVNTTSGVWFVKRDTSGALVSGLDLPEAPDNWEYEAFVEIQDTTLSLGTFTAPFGADDENLYGAGQKAGFAFPGGDLIKNAPGSVVFPADLSGARVYVQIIPPLPENLSIPFQNNLILYEITLPAALQADVIYEMNSNSSSLPDGSLDITLEIY